ncbi:MAG: hypothetical protein LUG19_10720, partial [Desulfovibrio sp.]|nr:hypothetical protein [Desulfovibrio sp.]
MKKSWHISHDTGVKGFFRRVNHPKLFVLSVMVVQSGTSVGWRGNFPSETAGARRPRLKNFFTNKSKKIFQGMPEHWRKGFKTGQDGWTDSVSRENQAAFQQDADQGRHG